jgi:hypothetical protein
MKSCIHSFGDSFFVFFDGTLIYSSSWSKHLWHIPLVFEKLQEHKLYLKWSKCFFGEWRITYLGHMISMVGTTMDEQKVQSMLYWPVLSSV